MKIKKLFKIILPVLSIIMSFCLYGDGLADGVILKGSEERPYTIKKGDTLWDISGEYLNNPFLWPNIWDRNEYIKNPDLIYPGNRILIPFVIITTLLTGEAEVPHTPSEATVSPPPLPSAPDDSISAPVPSAPPSTDIPPIPPLLKESKGGLKEITEFEEPVVQPDAISMIGGNLVFSSGYISDDIKSSGIITDSPEGRNIFAGGDNVNIVLHSTDNGVSIGDWFTIFRRPVNIFHPRTGKRVGMLFIPVGILEIYRVQGKDAAGRIIKSYNYSSHGDLIQPYQPSSQPFGPVDEPLDKIDQTTPGIQGYIIESYESKVLNAEYNIVYLDKGASDGITPEAIFQVTGERPGHIIGELIVISVQANTSTALITKSIEPFGVGNRVVTSATR